jgi:hypothetical protein
MIAPSGKRTSAAIVAMLATSADVSPPKNGKVMSQRAARRLDHARAFAVRCRWDSPHGWAANLFVMR